MAALQLLVSAQAPEYRAVILEAIIDPQENIRATAVHFLPQALQGDRLVREYVRLLRDPSAWVRYNAAEALERYPAPDALEAMLGLVGDESIETRDRAIHTVVLWNVPDVQERLLGLAGSSEPVVAGAASCALVRYFGEEVDLETLHEYLRLELGKLRGPPYSGTDNVINLIRVIALVGDESSIGVLDAARGHAHRNVQREAERAMIEVRKPRSERRRIRNPTMFPPDDMPPGDE